MSQFKPMVKMMTDEPSVILKLKKGGGVKHKKHEEHGHKAMHDTEHHKKHHASQEEHAEHGEAPKKPSMAERRKAMSGALLNSKKGGKVAKHEDAAQDRAMIKKALAGKKFASGGEIDADETKTTIKGNAGKFLKTKVVDGDKADKSHGTKGIKEKNSGGYATGGTIEGNAGKFLKTKVVDGDKADKAHGTGGIKEKNAGGFKKGGKVPGIGRAIEHDGDWANRPADTAKAGKVNGITGGVRESNAGGFKKGGAAKKHFATGGNVVNDGRAVAMPKKALSRPVANSLQSGTFKKGGNVKRYADGGMATTPAPQVSQPLQQQQLPMGPTYATDGGPAVDAATQRQINARQRTGGMGGGMGQPPMGSMGNMRPPMGGFGGMHGGFGGMRPPMMGGGMGRPPVAQPMPVGSPQPIPNMGNDIGPGTGAQPMPVGSPQPLPNLGNDIGPADPYPKMYKRGGKVQRFNDGDSVGVDPTPSNSSNMRRGSKGNATDAYNKALLPDEDDMTMAHSIRRAMGLERDPSPTQKQSIHAGGYRKGGSSKR